MDTMQRYLAQERAGYGGGATMLADAPPTVPNPFLAPAITFSGGWVDVTGGPFPLRGYLVRPDGVAPGLGGQARPAVVVVPHAGRGLVPYGRDIAEALASAGYIALAMDMLSGHGGAEQYDNDQEQLMDALSAISAEDHTAGLLAAVAHLQGLDEVSGVGAMGFCLGGGLVWRLTTRCPDLKASTIFYGFNPPLEEIPQVRAATLSLCAENDDLINPDIPALEEALQRAGTTHGIRFYPGTGHGFLSHSNPQRYRPEAAREAWRDAIAWLDLHLKAGE